MAVEAHEVVMNIDPTIEGPSAALQFNYAALMVMQPPQAGLAADNVNVAPSSIGYSFQAAATFEPAMAPEPAPPTVYVNYNPDLIRGCENATYALQNLQLSGGSLLTDCLNMACTSMDHVAEIGQPIAPAPIPDIQQNAPVPEALQQTWTPSPNMMA